jgi:hypothetical protein
MVRKCKKGSKQAIKGDKVNENNKEVKKLEK